jgi:hypothetical protein
MPIFLKNGKKCLFIHIPKAAGSSFEKVAGLRSWKKYFSINGVRAKELDFVKSTPQHFHAELLEMVFRLDKFDAVIAICRHPMQRLKSEYYWQLSTSQTTLSPCAWLNEVQSLIKQNPYLFDNHLRPQFEFIPQGIDVNIYKLEEDGLFKAIKKLLELDADFHVNKYFDYPRFIPKIHEKRSKKSTDVELYFEKKHEEIKSMYSKDYEYFDY